SAVDDITTHGRELWRSDGTAAGTVLVKDINPGSGSSNPEGLTLSGGHLFFTADDGVHGVELWDPPVGLGPVVDLSDPDVLAAYGTSGAEKESYIAVNPANPKNIVATWFGGFPAVGTVTAVTLDGGKNWQQVIVPVTQSTGGGDLFQSAVDPWLSFAPN